MNNLQEIISKIKYLIHECVVTQELILKQGKGKKQNPLLADAYDYLGDAEFAMEDTIRRLEAYAASE